MIELMIKEKEWEEPFKILGKRFEFSIGKTGRLIKPVLIKDNILSVCANQEEIKIKGPSKVSIIRGLGEAILKEQEGILEFSINEEIAFSFNGLMIDCSRNGVININYAKELIERLAIMGHSVFMLYMEDIYEIEEEPYFGYLRGRYSKEELREIDEYAKLFGIELIPCIQTLAHLDQFLAWDNIKEKYVDIENILCVRKPEVLDLLEHMIKTLAETLTSKRIHIGMDEAYHLGRGLYADKNGLEEKPEIMKKHLEDMLSICSRYGIRPMIWDDMFFREYSFIKEEDYQIPEGIDLMYWDYYNNEKEHYKDNIKKRRRLTANTMFAGGAWKWTGYAPHHSKTYASVNASLLACKELGVKEVIVTSWADDGGECPVSASLFGTTLFAEHGYHKNVDLEEFKKRLLFCSGLSYEDFMMQESFDILPQIKDKTATVTPSKYMLYEDILCSMFVFHTKTIQEDLTEYYKDLAEKFQLSANKEENTYYRKVKEFYFAFAKVMKYKWNLGLNIWEAYQIHDKDKLKVIIEEQIIPLLDELKEFQRTRMEEWYLTNKSYGFEVLDLRIGGIIQRITTAKYRLEQYICEKIEKIEELEEVRLPATHYREEGMGEILHFNRSLRCMTASKMTW